MSKPEQSVKDSAKIFQGAQLVTAFKSDPGQAILAAMVEQITDDLVSLLFDPMEAEDAMLKLNGIRAKMSLYDGLGDAIRTAASLVARQSVQNKLSTKLNRKEDADEEKRPGE